MGFSSRLGLNMESAAKAAAEQLSHLPSATSMEAVFRTPNPVAAHNTRAIFNQLRIQEARIVLQDLEPRFGKDCPPELKLSEEQQQLALILYHYLHEELGKGESAFQETSSVGTSSRIRN